MNVKDVINTVVTSMKPVIDVNNITMKRGGAIESISIGSTNDIKKLYVGQPLKIVFAEGTYYCKIATINTAEMFITVDLTTDGFGSSPLSVDIILVYDHGHPLEVVNRVKEYQESDTLKYESFPRICLFHDFEEKITFETNVSCTLVIVTNTEPHYTASQRYTNSFDPILIPLYELFLNKLADSPYLGTTENNYFKHTKIDRLYWGKNGLYGNTGNIFNDYIDAIEINNLELIINNC